MVNAYSYDDARQLRPEKAMGVMTEVSDCPWNAGHKLARIVVKARETDDPEAIVAEEVRVRVEFNPNRVSSYRLIGYENRLADGADHRDDRADLKSGHTLTALYEIVPTGNFDNSSARTGEALKYQRPSQLNAAALTDELFTVVLKFKSEDDPFEQMVEAAAVDPGLRLADASPDFRFAAAVAQFGLVLLDAPAKGQGDLGGIRLLAEKAMGEDAAGDRARFLRLVEQAQSAVVVN
jgi:Ca-activated chloride channel family protein